MPSTITDRIYGISASVAVKAPCKVATTANITLSGIQTIDGVSVASGDRVLVKDQTDPVDNGIWVVSSSSWTRDADFDGQGDIVDGTIVFVNEGTTNSLTFWHVSATDPITIGTDSITFTAGNVGVNNATEATAGLIEIATQAEVNAGTDDQRAVTPLKLATTINNLAVTADGSTTARDLSARFSDIAQVEDYGAVGDGVTDDATAIQAAATALTNGGTLSFKAGKTYKLNSGITLNNYTLVDLKTAKIDFSGAPTANTIFSASGSFGTGYSLTANAVVGATSLTMSSSDAANLAADDWIQVYSETVYDTGWTAAKIAEYVQVSGVASGTVSLKSPLVGGDYNTASTAKARKVTFAEGVRVVGGRLQGSSTAATIHTAVKFVQAKDCEVVDVYCRYFNGNAIELRNSIGCNVTRPTVEDALDSNSGYGVNMVSCTQDCNVTDGVFRRCRHAVTNSAGSGEYGIVRRITYKGLTCWDTINTGDAFDTHANGESIWFIGCRSFDSASSGFNLECRSGGVIGGQAFNSASNGITIALGSTVKNSTFKIADVLIDGCTNGVDARPATTLNTTATDAITLNNVTAINCSGCGLITGNGTSGATTLTTKFLQVIGGCYSGANANGSIFIQYNVESFLVTGANAICNLVAGSGIQIRGSYGAVNNNVITYSVTGADGSSSSACIRITDAGRITLNGNVGKQPSTSGGWGIRTTGSNSTILVGPNNEFSDCSNPGTTTVALTAASDTVTVPHNGHLTLVVDGEGAAADNLATISGTVAGQEVVIAIANAAHAITVKDGTGNLRLNADFAMDSLDDRLFLRRDGSNLYEIARSNNA